MQFQKILATTNRTNYFTIMPYNKFPLIHTTFLILNVILIQDTIKYTFRFIYKEI